ncbi:hypothetical protein E6W39_19050 [Kitasatospora acidiphila]|uniref:Uncharacterized protein n=1 Tax=Kitasatospora acidiphila TaxID=2567942 RepID=A0A540W4L1_9ACTN|nr:hypothetical protein [Kitasatospora acidiphila]TQF03950.1 hypothetical protein E6W39_19050 [Kitasatospora acidiphila]
MTEIDWTAIHSLAQRVGKNVARKWPGIEAEDLSQEALTALVEHPEMHQKLSENPGLMGAFMTRVATRYASRERYDYTVRSARYLYTPAEVRGLLENAYWDESLRETSVPTGPDDRTALLVHEHVCIALWDLDAAIESLSGMDQMRLTRRFRDGEEYPTDAARKAVDRAIDTLTQRINERINRTPVDHDGPGSRKAGRMPAAV